MESRRGVLALGAAAICVASPTSPTMAEKFSGRKWRDFPQGTRMIIPMADLEAWDAGAPMAQGCWAYFPDGSVLRVE